MKCVKFDEVLIVIVLYKKRLKESENYVFRKECIMQPFWKGRFIYL